MTTLPGTCKISSEFPSLGINARQPGRKTVATRDHSIRPAQRPQGPILGLFALNLSMPHGVIEGSSVEKDIVSSKTVYLRDLSGGRADRFHTPDRSAPTAGV